MKDSIRSAVFYPLIMIFATFLILAVLLFRVLPVFARVFEQTGAALPVVFQVVANSEDTAVALCAALLILAVLGVMGYMVGRRTEKGRRFFSRLYERSPFTKALASRSVSGEIIYSISLLLSSGMSPDDAAELLLEMNESPSGKNKLNILQTLMRSGSPFSRALSESGLLPSAYTAVIAVGAKTGRLDEMMSLAAQRLSEDIDQQFQRRIALVEPIVVIVMCLFIGAVLLSVMLPLIRIMTSV